MAKDVPLDSFMDSFFSTGDMLDNGMWLSLAGEDAEGMYYATGAAAATPLGRDLHPCYPSQLHVSQPPSSAHVPHNLPLVGGVPGGRALSTTSSHASGMQVRRRSLLSLLNPADTSPAVAAVQQPDSITVLPPGEAGLGGLSERRAVSLCHPRSLQAGPPAITAGSTAPKAPSLQRHTATSIYDSIVQAKRAAPAAAGQHPSDALLRNHQREQDHSLSMLLHTWDGTMPLAEPSFITACTPALATRALIPTPPSPATDAAAVFACMRLDVPRQQQQHSPLEACAAATGSPRNAAKRQAVAPAAGHGEHGPWAVPVGRMRSARDMSASAAAAAGQQQADRPPSQQHRSHQHPANNTRQDSGGSGGAGSAGPASTSTARHMGTVCEQGKGQGQCVAGCQREDSDDGDQLEEDGCGGSGGSDLEGDMPLGVGATAGSKRNKRNRFISVVQRVLSAMPASGDAFGSRHTAIKPDPEDWPMTQQPPLPLREHDAAAAAGGGGGGLLQRLALGASTEPSLDLQLQPGAGGGAGSSGKLVMADVRPLFDREVEVAARALGMGMTSFKLQCRALGIGRWPQRRLASLDKLAADVQLAPELDAVQKQELLLRIQANKELVMNDPNTPLTPELSRLREVQFKRNHLRRTKARHAA